MISTAQPNEMAEESHANMIRWWQNPETGAPIERNKGELLMLVITELAEACEGVRKDLMDDKCPARKMEEVELADALIRLLDYAGGFGLHILRWDTISEKEFQTIIDDLSVNRAESLLLISMAVTVIYGEMQYGDQDLHESSVSQAVYLIIAYCDKFRLDLMGAYKDKTEFNKTRIDHSHEARKLASGKKF